MTEEYLEWPAIDWTSSHDRAQLSAYMKIYEYGKRQAKAIGDGYNRLAEWCAQQCDIHRVYARVGSLKLGHPTCLLNLGYILINAHNVKEECQTFAFSSNHEHVAFTLRKLECFTSWLKAAFWLSEKLRRRWMSTSATPTTQNEGGCHQVPRLPRKMPRRHRRPSHPSGP